VQRLNQIRPDTLGHALRIPGVTPAAVAVLAAFVGRARGDAPSPDGESADAPSARGLTA
jgi:hypothetical protein